MSLSGSVLLKIPGMWALVPLKLVLELGVGLVLRVLASQPSTLANYLLVLLLQQGLDYKQVEDIGLLAVKLVIGLVVRTFSQLELLSAGIILGPEIGKAIQPGWIVLDRDLRDEQPLWWICLECCEVFGR